MKISNLFLVFSFLFYSAFPYPSIVIAEELPEVPEQTEGEAEEQIGAEETPQETPPEEPIVEETVGEVEVNDEEQTQPEITEEILPEVQSDDSTSPVNEQENTETHEENIDNPGSQSSSSTTESSSETETETDTPSLHSTSVPGDPSATNTNTGVDSTNVSETNVDNTTTVENTNNAVTFNDAYLKSETGNNNASYNTGSGIITTQKADGRGELLNIINNNVTNVQPNSTGPINVENGNTGAGSTNEAAVNITNETVVRNINNSNTVNRVAADVISGRNNSEHNTGHGLILTGQANLGLNFMSLANTNFTGVNNLQAQVQNIFGNHIGNLEFQQPSSHSSQLAEILIQAGNQNTGAGSTNSAVVNVDDQTIVANSNNGRIENEIRANVISGQNRASYNTGTGSVASGAVNSSVNVTNFLNANVTASNFWFNSLNVFGNWTGNVNLPSMPLPNLAVSSYEVSSSNSQTGSDSENEAEVEVENSVEQTNNNEAEIANNFFVKTDTGSNRTSYNNGSGAIQFGNAEAQANVANVADLNITGDAWWLLVVNKFGNWSGTTIGSPDDMIVDSNSEVTILSPQNGGIEVENDSTGADSNNSAGAHVNHGSENTNTNNAVIENDISVVAVSGENEAQYNLGHGYIDAGDIRSVVNSVNVANVNVNVGNFLIGVVNVFGDWSGNIVFNNTSGSQSLGSNSNTGGGTPGTVTSSNENTGADSENTSSTNSDTNVNVNNTNNSTTNNNSSATSSSGQNNANYNTGSGIVTTGNATVDSNIQNQANNNDVTVGNVNCGDAESANTNTGADSENTSTASTECNIDVSNTNNTENNNNVVVNNSTGSNTASYNTGNGVVDTGWVDTFVTLYNEANENKITIGQVEEIIDDDDGNGGGDDDGDGDGDNGGGNGGGDNGGGNGGGGNGGGGNGGGGNGGGGNGGGGNGGGGNGGGGGSGGGGGTSQTASSDGSGGGSACPTVRKSDINGDGKVDIFDLSILLANWSTRFKDQRADINCDGKVDLRDLSVVLGDWPKRGFVLATSISTGKQ